MADESLYRRVMGRPEPTSESTPVEIGKSAGQFAGALLHRLATGILGDDQMAESAAITEAVKIDRGGRTREALRKELRRFLANTVQSRDVAIPVWLNLCGYMQLGGHTALVYADRYSLDPVETGRALLVGLDVQRTETLCHIAGMTGADAFALVCNAVQVETNAGRPLTQVAISGGKSDA